MELSDYIRIIKRRGWLIILLAILTAGAAYGYSKMQEEIYKSSVRLLITSRPDFGQTQTARNLLLDYAAWLQSSYRAEQVIDVLDLDMQPLQLLGDMRVAAASDSNILTIEIENTNGDVGNDIARTWGNLFIQWRNEENAGLQEGDRIRGQFLDEPRYGLDSPKTNINTAAGLVFGALLGLILIFLLEWYESGILRRTEDVERYLNIPVVGKIPQ